MQGDGKSMEITRKQAKPSKTKDCDDTDKPNVTPTVPASQKFTVGEKTNKRFAGIVANKHRKC